MNPIHDGFVLQSMINTNMNIERKGTIMNILCLTTSLILFFASAGYSFENTVPSLSSQATVETRVQEMEAEGVPPGSARRMLVQMHQHQFKAEHMAQAQQELIRCAKAGLPTEPVIDKAMEGMAKHASEDRIIAAMKTVGARYATARQLAKTMAKDDETMEALTRTLVDTMTAGMKSEDLETISNRITIRTRQQTANRAESERLAIQTMETARTMARLGIRSADISATLCKAMDNHYNHQEMKQLRHRISQSTRGMSHQQIANQHAESIGNAGGIGSGSSGGGGNGSGGNGGGNGSGSGGGGNGGGGGR